jgi:hypothetical protein
VIVLAFAVPKQTKVRVAKANINTALRNFIAPPPLSSL